MAERFQRGTGYSTACSTRSALNSAVILTDGVELSQHPLMKRFMKGIFHLKPPLPKYTEVWDVGTLISYIRNLGHNCLLDRKTLTLKLTALLSILTAQRVSTITYLSYNHTKFSKSGDRVTFTPVRLSKHHRRGKAIKPITVTAYPADDRLCVVSTLRAYFALRGTQPGQLLLTHKRPYHSPHRDTVAGWLKQVLRRAGINTAVFSAHSYRGASTSSAHRSASVSIQQVLRRGEWSSERTWRNHYDLPVVSVPESFSTDLLDAHRPHRD